MNTEADKLRRRLSSVLVALRCHDDCPQCAAEIPLIERAACVLLLVYGYFNLRTP